MTGPGEQSANLPALAPKAQRLLSDFGRRPEVTDANLANLHSVIDSSPTLIENLNKSVTQGDLLGFGILEDENASGEYDSHLDRRQINLPLWMLTDDEKARTALVLGHETQHALNRAEMDTADTKYEEMVRREAQPGGSCDHTEAIEYLIDADRRDEAKAELVGWNCAVEQVRSSRPNATLQDVAGDLRSMASGFVERMGSTGVVTPRSNLKIGPDLKFEPANDKNIEGMGENFYDVDGKQAGLGQDGKASYRDLSIARGLGMAAEIQREIVPPEPGKPERPIRFDGDRIEYNHNRVQGAGVDLGENTNPIPVVDDPSLDPPRPAALFHTAEPDNTRHRVKRAEPARGQQKDADPVHLALVSNAGPATAAVRNGAPKPTPHQHAGTSRPRAIDPRCAAPYMPRTGTGRD